MPVQCRLNLQNLRICTIVIIFFLNFIIQTITDGFLECRKSKYIEIQKYLNLVSAYFEQMSQESIHSKQILLEKKSALAQLWFSLKQSIFDVLFVVLDKAVASATDVTIKSLFYESGIDYLQMMQYPFNFTIIMVWNGGQTLNNTFKFLTTVLSINTLMPSINYNAFLIMLYFVIFMIGLVIADIIYVSYSFTKKKFRFTLPLVLLAQIVPLFVTFLFVPVVEFLLNVINCSPSTTNPSITVMQYFPNVQCFAGVHIVHASITLFFTAVFATISTVVAMCLYEPRMTANTIVCRRSSDGQVIFIINKIICQFFLSLTPFNATWPYIALMFFPALWLFYFYHFKQPYYNKEVGKLYRIFSGYYFWTVLMLTISQVCLLLNFDFQGSMVIWFCGLPFMALSIAYESKSNIDNLFSSNLKFKTGEELEVHLNYVLQLVNSRKKDENSNMLLVGYIQKHIETCVEDDCPIKMKKRKKEEYLNEMDENCQLLILQIERMYKQGIKKFPRSTKLHISLAFFYMEQLHLNAKAYEEFVLADRLSPTFIEQFIIYRFKKIIKDKLEENKKEENDLIEVIRFDNHIMLCEQAMLQSAKLHKQFWTELVEETPNLQKLNENGGRIIEIVHNVKSNYEEIKKINSHSPEIIHNYGVYTMFVSQNITEGKNCLALSKRAYYEKVAKGELLSGGSELEVNGDNYSLVVSASQANMGKVMAVNDSFIELSGYLKEEITEKSIDKLLPQVFNFYHEYAMNQWLLDASRQYMNHEGNRYFKEGHRGFIKQKSGFIVPVFYRVSYSIQEEKFRVFFKQQKQLSESLNMRIYIITDNKGVIREISPLGFAYFSLNRDNLSANERYIDEFGINFLPDTYSEDGNYFHIPKKPIFRGQESLESKQDLANSHAEISLDIKREDGEQFLVKAEKIMMPFQEEQEEDQQYTSKFIKNGKKDIGSIFLLEKVVNNKNIQGQLKLESLGAFGEEIMQFYQVEQPNDHENQLQMQQDNPLLTESRQAKRSHIREVIEGFKIAEKQDLKQRTFHNYAGRIKTYRLVNNQLKRVAEQYGDNSSQFDELDEEKIAISAFQIQKLKNPLFVSKIKSAINTDIDHREVNVLKIAFTLFLLCLFTLLIVSYLQISTQLTNMSNTMQQNELWIQDQFFINNLFHLSYNYTDETQAIDAKTKYTMQYNVTFDPDIQVTLYQQNGFNETVSLNQAMVMIQGQLLNLFLNNTLAISSYLTLQNYYLSIYPALSEYQSVTNVSPTTTILYLIAMAIIASAIVAVWIYNIMKIDLKCFDIILWFLDIPVAYVGYLQTNCNTFVKSYTPVKELTEKGINFHDKNLYIDDYKAISAKESDENDKFNEENKARKILIARYKKRTFLSHCDCGYLQLSWLLLYSLIFSISYLLLLQKQIKFFNFIDQEWTVTGRQFLWSCTIPNNLRLMIDQNVTQIGSLNLYNFEANLQANFLNTVSTQGLTADYAELLNYGGDVTDYYLKIFKGNVCTENGFTDDNVRLCKSYLQGKLEGGISSFFVYYAAIDRRRYLQAQHIQYDYVNDLLVRLFHVWAGAFTSSISSVQNILTLVLVLYAIVSVIGFILLWLIYLRRLNVRLNQTVQMLNMIPIRMLPKGRKDIRDFFNWIIKEANKYKVDQ